MLKWIFEIELFGRLNVQNKWLMFKWIFSDTLQYSDTLNCVQTND